jgi:hypothetical protein
VFNVRRRTGKICDVFDWVISTFIFYHLLGTISQFTEQNLFRQHPEPPTDLSLVSEISHVALAFMSSSRFNQLPPTTSTAGSHPTADIEWPFFTTVSKTRTQFKKGTKILVAIGGWGDDEGFETAARTEEGQELWASNVARMVSDTGADGLLCPHKLLHILASLARV